MDQQQHIVACWKFLDHNMSSVSAVFPLFLPMKPEAVIFFNKPWISGLNEGPTTLIRALPVKTGYESYHMNHRT